MITKKKENGYWRTLPKMRSIDWNDMSELGLIERINKEILHPLGLSMSREVESGHSKKIFIADDGYWEYPTDRASTIIPDEMILKKITEWVSQK